MKKKTKPKQETPENLEKNTENDSWAYDQSEHKYYYDDAYAYEVYTEETNENEDDRNPSKTC